MLKFSERRITSKQTISHLLPPPPHTPPPHPPSSVPCAVCSCTAPPHPQCPNVLAARFIAYSKAGSHSPRSHPSRIRASILEPARRRRERRHSHGHNPHAHHEKLKREVRKAFAMTPIHPPRNSSWPTMYPQSNARYDPPSKYDPSSRYESPSRYDPPSSASASPSPVEPPIRLAPFLSHRGSPDVEMESVPFPRKSLSPDPPSPLPSFTRMFPRVQ